MEITVARALVKEKTLLDKINKLTEKLGQNAYATTKHLSPLSSEKDIAKNHAEAIEHFAATKNSIKDSISYFVKLNLAVMKSNLETYITTTEFGKISVAEAILIYQKLKEPYTNYSRALNNAVQYSQEKSDRYNRELRMNTTNTTITPEQYKDLESLPVLFFNYDEVNEAGAKRDFILNELNLLINESNATTVINVDVSE